MSNTNTWILYKSGKYYLAIPGVSFHNDHFYYVEIKHFISISFFSRKLHKCWNEVVFFTRNNECGSRLYLFVVYMVQR